MKRNRISAGRTRRAAARGRAPDAAPSAPALRRLQEALREDRAEGPWWTPLFDAAPVGYLLLDTSGNIHAINETGAQWLGRRRTELIGRPLLPLLVQSTRKRYMHYLSRLRRGEARVTCEVELNSANGGRRLVELISEPVGFADIPRPLIATVAVDFTARHLTQHAVQSVRSELEGLVRERTAELAANQQRLRMLAAGVAQAEERERRRIAAGLHDEVGQLLVACGLHVESLRRTSHASDPERLTQTADTLEALLKEAAHHVRELTFQLSSPTLYQLGLGPAVAELGENFNRRFGLDVRIERGTDLRALPAEIGATLYHAVRELLFNARKHAGTPHVWVRLANTADALRIQVEDRGRGFEFGKKNGHGQTGEGGFGLMHIREQIGHLGGRVEITSRPGKGTRVILEVPAPAEGAL